MNAFGEKMVSNFKLMRKAYLYQLKKLRMKVESGNKIRIGFGVVYESVFPLAPVMEKMAISDIFDPFIVIVPDTSRGIENEIRQAQATKAILSQKYHDILILHPYDNKTRIYKDFSSECDMFCTANPFDPMTAPAFRIDHFWRKHIPIFYVNYHLHVTSHYQPYLREWDVFAKFWRIYADNEVCIKDLAVNPYKPDYVLSGYPKMDALFSQKFIPRNRKRVIIAPTLPIDEYRSRTDFGDFLSSMDFFLELPNLYPEMDFVYRPHPLIDTVLAKEKKWGEEKASLYWKQLSSLPNVTLERKGDYFETFANSDALIYDGGSFVATYLFTGKPSCRIHSPGVDISTEYNELGKECLNCNYFAQDPSAVCKFLDEIVSGGEDPKYIARENTRRRVAINYPHSADFIINDIEKAIRCA